MVDPALLEYGQREAAKQGIPWNVFRALIQSESSWQTDVVNSGTGALGIAQFLPSTAAEIGIDPNDPYQALSGAAAYLKRRWREAGANHTEQGWLDAVALYKGYGSGGVTDAERSKVAGILQRAGATLSLGTVPDAVVSGGDAITQKLAEKMGVDPNQPGFVSQFLSNPFVLVMGIIAMMGMYWGLQSLVSYGGV